MWILPSIRTTLSAAAPQKKRNLIIPLVHSSEKNNESVYLCVQQDVSLLPNTSYMQGVGNKYILKKKKAEGQKCLILSKRLFGRFVVPCKHLSKSLLVCVCEQIDIYWSKSAC